MSILALFLAAVVVLLLAYRFYGRYVSEKLGLDDERPTPAHTHGDGVDYVPTRSPVVLGHHFASIAGAAPIVGPVLAVAFGWIPALLWIVLGGIFFGAVHDLTSLVASLRHEGKSIGEVIERHIGGLGKRLFLIFSFSTLILVIAIFADIVAKTFSSIPSAASASVLFIVVAVGFGGVMRRLSLPFWLTTLVGVALTYAMVALGYVQPVSFGYSTWMTVLFAYVFVAAVTPVWVLLQPRDYLNSFLLYGMMILGGVGLFFARPTVAMETTVRLHTEQLGYIFPVLFVTIACGAISGFHSLVASGTTSKQIDKESDARLIGYGGMLIESLLAVLALVSVVVLPQGEYVSRLGEVGPVTLFSEGLGGFIASLGIPAEMAVSFAALVVSAFALTTLDTCTRLARYAVQEYFEERSGRPAQVLASNRFAGTGLVVLLSGALVLSGEFSALWPIFGSANQLLGALALLAVSVWLVKKEISPTFTLVPMVFMFAVTLSSLALFAWDNFADQSYVLGIIATFLFALAIVLIGLARRSLRTLSGEAAVEA